jgi:hypothetical protein
LPVPASIAWLTAEPAFLHRRDDAFDLRLLHR